MAAQTSSNPGPATQINALVCVVGRSFRIKWTAKAGSPITISSDQALNADGKLDKQLEASGADEFLDVTPTLAGDFIITITAYDKVGGDVMQSIEDDVSVVPDVTQLLPPWKKGDSVAGPSSFHLITQCIAGKNVHGSHDPANPVISKNGSDANGNFSWTENGCGPASVAGTMRWSQEQGIISDDALKAVTTGGSKNNGDAYMQLLFPDLKGQVPTTEASDCDLGTVCQKAQAKYGLSYNKVSVANPTELSALLKVAPVICTWSTPSHFSTVHGMVLDANGIVNVWIADPGACLANGTKSSYWKDLPPATGVGTPSGGAGATGDLVYISVPWAYFSKHLSVAHQMTKP